MTVCVLVAGLAGLWCSDHPQVTLIGDCRAIWFNEIRCTAEIDDFVAVASYFNPLLGGTNCFEDTCDYLGDGTPTETAFGWAVACPIGMYGYKIHFVYEHGQTQSIGVWECRDHGGDIHPTFGLRWTGTEFITTWYIPYDFLLYEPEWWTYATLFLKVQPPERTKKRPYDSFIRPFLSSTIK